MQRAPALAGSSTTHAACVGTAADGEEAEHVEEEAAAAGDGTVATATATSGLWAAAAGVEGSRSFLSASSAA